MAPSSRLNALIAVIMCGIFSPTSTCFPTSETQELTTAQHILEEVLTSFGRQSWSVGGSSHLEYTRSAINFLDTNGVQDSFQAHCFGDELKDNPIINNDFISTPVEVSGSILNRDLSLVSGPTSNPKHALIQCLGIAQSIPGEISLSFLLMSPQTDVNLLQARQRAIKTIANDEQLLNESNRLINIVAANQKELAIVLSSRWIDDWGRPNGRGGFSVFDLPVINKLGRSLIVKNLQYYTELIAGKASYGAQITFLACALIYLAKRAGIQLPQSIYNFQKANQDRIAQDGCGIVTDGDQKIFSLLPGKYNPLARLRGTNSFDAIIILYVLVQLKALFHDTEWQYASLLQTHYFIKTVSKAAQTLATIRDMYATTKTCKDLRALADLTPFYDFFEKDLVHNKDLAKIFSLARSSHISLTYSPFRPAAAQHFFELVKENKVALNALLIGYGRLEVYLGCAQLYNKQLQSPNQFCFAEYKESQTPLYQATNLWNPLLDAEKAIGSDINFEEHSGKRIYLLTGANEGGKSIFLKSVPLGALLAQTLGIVPANTCRIAPFEIIETYLNITDNIAQGHSLFRAEAVRARELLHRISATQGVAPKRALIVFDELFNGTSHTEATALAYGVAEYLEKQTNVCGVFATHFPFLTTLEQTCTSLENRCVKLHKDANNSWKSTYIVQPGVSNQHVALDILAREGITGEIMETAQKVIEKITPLSY